MSSLAQIMELFQTLNQQERKACAHSIIDAIAQQKIPFVIPSKIENASNINLNEFPFPLFPHRPTDPEVARYLQHVSKQEFLLDADYGALATQIGLKYSTISRKCTASIGIPLGKAITLIRLEKCRIQLKNSLDSSTGISFDQGFKEYSSFNRSFKRKYSYAPREYRKLCKNGQIQP